MKSTKGATMQQYQEGLATGRGYAQADIRDQLGTGAEELMLRGEARVAVEDKGRSERTREFAAFQLGVVRGYREVTR